MINQTRILERGWTKEDLVRRLTPPREVPNPHGYGPPMKLWPFQDILAAENNEAFALHLAQRNAEICRKRDIAAERKAARDIIIVKQQELANALNTIIVDAENARVAEERYIFIESLNGQPRFELDGYIPSKSTSYCSDHDPAENLDGIMDTSKVFHLRSEGWAKTCMTRVHWRADDDSKARVILAFLNIIMEQVIYSKSGRTTIPQWGDTPIIGLRVQHNDAYMLGAFGDCVREYLLD